MCDFFLDAAVIQVIKEYETSLRVPLKTAIYEELMQSYMRLDTYMIFYYDDNIRMSKDKFQSKKVRRRKNLLKILYYDNEVYMFPYSRTESNECPAACPATNNVNVIIRRNVIVDEDLTNNARMRVALEERVDVGGMIYELTAEVEYDQVSFYNYTENKIVEDIFFGKFVDMFMFNLRHIKTKDLLMCNPLDLTNYGSRDFKELNKMYTSMREIIVHKLDGYKCKFCIKNGKVSYLDARQNFCNGVCPFLNGFEHVVFQGEVISEEVIVITDVIGGFVRGNDLHMPQPLEIYPFFDWIRSVNETDSFDMVLYNRPTVMFKVYLQTVVDPSAENLSPFKTDGYIIIQNANIFKFKIPTLDVIVENGYLKVTGRVEPITDEQFTNLKENYIYEVQQNKDGTYFIVRLRFDRNIPCDNQQFEAYLTELEFMRKCIRASKLEETKRELAQVNDKVSLYNNKKQKMIDQSNSATNL